jgi:biopolymer transport protein ExbB
VFEDIWIHTLEHLETGGWVMVPLIGISVVMFTLSVVKYLDLRSFSIGDKQIIEIVQIYHEPEFKVAVWQREILDSFIKRRTFNEKLDKSIIESLQIRQESFLDRYTKMIIILASVAPLLGLLGTVGGMITTFAVISQFGTGNAKALASGISEALITTQTGLIVAVPGLFLASFLSRRSEKYKERINRFCLGLLNYHNNIITCNDTKKGKRAYEK